MNNKKIDFSDCPITKTAEVLGGKWSLPIIFSLIKGLILPVIAGAIIYYLGFN